jgi:hypothetical protein
MIPTNPLPPLDGTRTKCATCNRSEARWLLDDNLSCWKCSPLSPYTQQRRIKDSFDKFHAEHPDVGEQLTRLALDLLDRGYNNYGIAGLFEVVRYHRITSGKDDSGFKLNNNYRSHYARLLMNAHPELDGFFHTRTLRTA